VDKWKTAGVRSNRAEVVSAALRANMRRKKDLPIALALQPVAAVAWAVVDGLAGEDELFAVALEAQDKLALHVGAFAERGLLGQIISECAPDEAEDEEDGEVEATDAEGEDGQAEAGDPLPGEAASDKRTA